MILTDKHEFVKELQDVESIRAKVFLKYLKTRRVHPITSEIKPEFREDFIRDVHKSIKIYFMSIDQDYSVYLKGLNLNDREEYWNRLHAYEAEAARIKDSEYTAKVKGRVTP